MFYEFNILLFLNEYFPEIFTIFLILSSYLIKNRIFTNKVDLYVIITLVFSLIIRSFTYGPLSLFLIIFCTVITMYCHQILFKKFKHIFFTLILLLCQFQEVLFIQAFAPTIISYFVITSLYIFAYLLIFFCNIKLLIRIGLFFFLISKVKKYIFRENEVLPENLVDYLMNFFCIKDQILLSSKIKFKFLGNRFFHSSRSLNAIDLNITKITENTLEKFKGQPVNIQTKILVGGLASGVVLGAGYLGNEALNRRSTESISFNKVNGEILKIQAQALADKENMIIRNQHELAIKLIEKEIKFKELDLQIKALDKSVSLDEKKDVSNILLPLPLEVLNKLKHHVGETDLTGTQRKASRAWTGSFSIMEDNYNYNFIVNKILSILFL